MKKIIYFLLLVMMYVPASFAQNSMTGFVYDGQTNNPLPGAAIYIPDLKTGTATNGNGYFRIERLPASRLLVQVKYLGFTTHTQIIDIRTTDTLRVFLQPTSIEGKEVVITGTAITSESERNSVAVKTVDRIDIITIPSNNLIDALAHTPGVSQITTGNAISKPVIRGLSFNRIITLHDGVRQEGQQWGDEHGIEIDKYAADKIEVMRGPASLMYGSDALGGVINILEPVTPQVNSLRGNFTTQFFTNEKLTGNSLMLEGNTNGLFGRFRGSFTDAAAYHTPLEKVDNSGYRETNFSSTVGLNKSWGFSHISASRYNSYIGLPVDVHFGAEEDEHEHEDEHGDEPEHVPGRDIDLPYQQVTHNKITLNNRFYIGNSQLTVKAGWQQNQRQEFEDEIDEPALFLDLHTWTGDVKYFFPEKNNWQRVIGVSGMHQINKNHGEEFLIPDYTLNDAGIFLYVKKNNPLASWNAGVRFDMREISTDELILTEIESDTVFDSFQKDFAAITGALGMTLRFNELFYMKANIGSGFRAPNISELASNGVHSSTFRYEKGNNSLKPEQSFQLDLSLLAQSKRIDGELSFFTNYITNFIYPAQFNNETIELGDVTFPLYRYVQGNALLSGFEFSLDAHLLHHLHFENAVSFVYGHNRLLDSPLPFMPPMSVHNELRYDFHFLETKTIKEPYVKFSVDNHLPQKRVDNFETETAGYSLINAGVGTTLNIKSHEWIISVAANNIADIKHFDHLNRLKNYGILNKGRNISFSLFIPFTLYSKG
ncbi:MAG: TonB-dependent receptor [Bacteroidia bacterium]